MHQITTAELKQAVKLDPAWALTLTAEVEVTDYCDMQGSAITHLSPLLHFTGKNPQGNVADFSECTALKTAAGGFHGRVNFIRAGIQEIGGLSVTQPDNEGVAASFWGCASLKAARGAFRGSVGFENSGVEKIEALTISQSDNNGEAASFDSCKSLKIAEGTFPGYVNFQESGVEKIGELTIIKPDQRGHAANFSECKALTTAEGTFPGYVGFYQAGIENIGELNITRPNNNGNYLTIAETPIAENPRKWLEGTNKPNHELRTLKSWLGANLPFHLLISQELKTKIQENQPAVNHTAGPEIQ